MTVEEMLEWSVSQENVDLQALILFLVYEKKTLSLDDDSEKIRFYTQDKFKGRMNEFLSSYKKKLNMQNKTFVYSIITQKGTLYAVAQTENDARFLVSKYNLTIESIEVMPENYTMVDVDPQGNETYFTIKELKERATKTPSILGGF